MKLKRNETEANVKSSQSLQVCMPYTGTTDGLTPKQHNAAVAAVLRKLAAAVEATNDAYAEPPCGESADGLISAAVSLSPEE